MDVIGATPDDTTVVKDPKSEKNKKESVSYYTSLIIDYYYKYQFLKMIFEQFNVQIFKYLHCSLNLNSEYI